VALAAADAAAEDASDKGVGFGLRASGFGSLNAAGAVCWYLQLICARRAAIRD